MGLFDFLFGRKNGAPAQREQREAASQESHAVVNFDPDFIPKLKEDHRSLLALFVQIKKAYQTRNFDDVKKGLQDFQLALNLHLAIENSKFYAYLRRNLNNGSPELVTMNLFFDEMQDIGKVVTQFLRSYVQADFTAEIEESFGRELESIGVALASRIDREEETLYKLYSPS